MLAMSIHEEEWMPTQHMPADIQSGSSTKDVALVTGGRMPRKAGDMHCFFDRSRDSQKKNMRTHIAA